jgi:hypothetical protein
MEDIEKSTEVKKTVFINGHMYVIGDPIPNSYNGTNVYPSWNDPKSTITPGLTLQIAIAKDLKMHAVAIIRSNTPHSVASAMQIVNTNWETWRQIFC